MQEAPLAHEVVQEFSRENNHPKVPQAPLAWQVLPELPQVVAQARDSAQEGCAQEEDPMVQQEPLAQGVVPQFANEDEDSDVPQAPLERQVLQGFPKVVARARQAAQGYVVAQEESCSQEEDPMVQQERLESRVVP
jgi:hypothetical protein